IGPYADAIVPCLSLCCTCLRADAALGKRVFRRADRGSPAWRHRIDSWRAFPRSDLKRNHEVVGTFHCSVILLFWPIDIVRRVRHRVPYRRVWVVIAAYNEAGAIARVISNIASCGFSVAVVDDGSVDATDRVAQAHGAVVL